MDENKQLKYNRYKCEILYLGSKKSTSQEAEKYVSATVDVKRDLMFLAYHKWPNSVVCLAEKTVFSKHIVSTYSLIQQILSPPVSGTGLSSEHTGEQDRERPRPHAACTLLGERNKHQKNH